MWVVIKGITPFFLILMVFCRPPPPPRGGAPHQRSKCGTTVFFPFSRRTFPLCQSTGAKINKNKLCSMTCGRECTKNKTFLILISKWRGTPLSHDFKLGHFIRGIHPPKKIEWWTQTTWTKYLKKNEWSFHYDFRMGVTPFHQQGGSKFKVVYLRLPLWFQCGVWSPFY